MLNAKDSETELVQEKLILTDVLRQSLTSGVVVVDWKTRVILFNREAASLTLLSADQVLNHTIDVLPISLQEVIQETFTTRRPVNERQVILREHAPPELRVQVRATLDQIAEEEKPGVVLLLNDLNRNREMEMNLRRLDRLARVGILSAGIAHEIKNALVAMKTFTELLLEQNKDTEIAGIVGHEIQRIDSLISQILKFAGPAKPAFSRNHLHEVLQTSLRLVQHQFDTHNIDLVRSLTSAHDEVNCDEKQLEQVFINLLLNAVEAIKEKGTLTVASEFIPPSGGDAAPNHKRQPGQICVTVRDTGAGIPPENLSRLFDPFFTTKTEGTGLGLAITRRIIQEHSGAIDVRSELNKGTVFTVALPLLPAKL
ncbi:MAG: ATP-binding protein [Verrucomicrobiota bacterium]